MTTTSTPSRRRRAGFAAVLMAGTALGSLAFWEGSAGAQQAAINPAPITRQAAVALPGFADLVDRVRPAVVTITATERAANASARSPFPEGSEQDQMFRRFFGDQAPQRGGQGQERPRGGRALGSGFVVKADGTIVTNNHVVREGGTVTVTLEDGRELPARVVGRDPRTDIAVLKVDAGAPLPFLELGDSARARVGDWVVAVGNPFGLGGTVTTGVVSARGRNIGQGPYDDFLQIDASINSGNSGGPLFALDGSVIGVNTAIFSPTGGSVGIGFAIPSNMVRQVVTQIEENGRVERGFLGATTQNLTPALASAMRLPRPEGALVGDIQPDSPAARSGLRPGDVVTKVGETAVANPRDLARLIGDSRPGSTVQLTVQRDGQPRDLSVTLATLQDGESNPARGGKPGQRGEREQQRGGPVGVALAPIDERARQALNLPEGARGAVVAQVRPESPAAAAGLREGDVIVGVGSRDVADVNAVATAIREAGRQPGTAVALRIIREGQSAFVAVQIPARG
ncbi:DegQ family serine endoprotease [Roseococcus sp. SYP-B2431]|uniref:DegQ family serine endoprotease n=1 Tax=Roseococcus sp. SYP-B2431 TaxID=2496640 RepID=UPI00103CBA0F|nr:DegQ family serine endoprotease [Roseococcus sp. SYP-B2431]TCH97540.1 DegQ family serine endoprotease [Roseococcus sp. SYP-B2431]